MNVTMIGDTLHEALLVAIKLAGPTLIGCMLIGVLIAIFQAVTQIHEQSLAFILKLITVMLFLLIAGGWMLQTLQEYTYHVFELMVR
ncbi:MAG: flagellar biosynthetic protein FliQ [Oscillospiraceae bacterium]|nr:flagellar biosynthetic protein FliQ [Oscillospiraceae bacterium]